MNKSQFFNDLGTGAWDRILSAKRLQSFKSWLQKIEKTGSQEALVRFVFLDSKYSRPFAMHMVCATVFNDNGGLIVKSFYLPSPQYFHKESHRLLVLPEQVKDLPLYCMPKNLMDDYHDKKSAKSA